MSPLEYAKCIKIHHNTRIVMCFLLLIVRKPQRGKVVIRSANFDKPTTPNPFQANPPSSLYTFSYTLFFDKPA